MVNGVTNVSGFAPTSRFRSPYEVMRERFEKRQAENREKLYNDLSAKEKSGQPLSDIEKMQLYFLKAMDIAKKFLILL